MSDASEVVLRIRAALLEDVDLERQLWIRSALRDLSPERPPPASIPRQAGSPEDPSPAVP